MSPLVNFTCTFKNMQIDSGFGYATILKIIQNKKHLFVQLDCYTTELHCIIKCAFEMPKSTFLRIPGAIIILCHSNWQALGCNATIGSLDTNKLNVSKVQITCIFIGQTHLVFGKRVCTCVTKHSNAFRTFLNWLKNSKRVLHEPKLHISRLPLFANFDLWSVSVWRV